MRKLIIARIAPPMLIASFLVAEEWCREGQGEEQSRDGQYRDESCPAEADGEWEWVLV